MDNPQKLFGSNISILVKTPILIWFK